MQNCPRQLAMQSCVLCSFVRCGTSKTNLKKKKKRKQENFILDRFWPFSGHKNYIVSKLWNLQFAWFEIWQVFLWLYLKGGRVLNSKFCPKMGVWKWGNFGSQKVRSVINGTIFNHLASNITTFELKFN